MLAIHLKDHQVLGRAMLLILLVILKVQPKFTFPPRTAEDVNMATLHLTTRNFPTITQGVPIPYALPIVKNYEWTFSAGVKPPANIPLAVGSGLEARHSDLAARWRVREKAGDWFQLPNSLLSYWFEFVLATVPSASLSKHRYMFIPPNISLSFLSTKPHLFILSFLFYLVAPHPT